MCGGGQLFCFDRVIMVISLWVGAWFCLWNLYAYWVKMEKECSLPPLGDRWGSVFGNWVKANLKLSLNTWVGYDTCFMALLHLEIRFERWSVWLGSVMWGFKLALLGVLDFPKFEHRPALNPIKVRNQKRGLIFLKIYIYGRWVRFYSKRC